MSLDTARVPSQEITLDNTCFNLFINIVSSFGCTTELENGFEKSMKRQNKGPKEHNEK